MVCELLAQAGRGVGKGTELFLRALTWKNGAGLKRLKGRAEEQVREGPRQGRVSTHGSDLGVIRRQRTCELSKRIYYLFVCSESGSPVASSNCWDYFRTYGFKQYWGWNLGLHAR